MDYVEEHLGDIEKNIILLDESAARKDIVGTTSILKKMDYMFIPADDFGTYSFGRDYANGSKSKQN